MGSKETAPSPVPRMVEHERPGLLLVGQRVWTDRDVVEPVGGYVASELVETVCVGFEGEGAHGRLAMRNEERVEALIGADVEEVGTVIDGIHQEFELHPVPDIHGILEI